MTTTEDFDDLDLTGLEIEEEKPKRTVRKPRSDAGQPRGGRRPRVSTLVDQLLIPYATITTIASMGVPMTAEVMKGQGQSLVKGFVELCAPHPKMMAALSKVGKIGPASDVVTGCALIFLTLLVEIGRVPADNKIAQSLGITDLYNTMYSEPAVPDHNIPTQGPPSYAFGNTPYAG